MISSARGILFLGLASVLVSVLGLASTGIAQERAESDEPAEVERSAPSSVDEITVTGTQSDVTDIQSESQAITAFSMEELDRSNIVSVDQLAFNVPGLHVGQAGTDAIITLRGVSTENASPTGEAGVQFHVDGVNYARPSAARVAFFDLEGLQVIRGPQGSRGGKNSTAGWINVTTRKPTAEFSSDVDVQWGSYNQRRLRAHINIPINEYVQTRFAMFREERDGFQRNFFLRNEDRDAFDADDLGFRGHLRLLPSDALDVLFSYNYYEQKGVGAQEEVVPLEPAHSPCNPFQPPFGTGYEPLTNFPSFAGCAANPNRRVLGGVPAPLFAATGFEAQPFPLFFEGTFFPTFENPATAGESRAVATGAALRPHEIYVDRAADQSNQFWGWSTTLDYSLPDMPLVSGSQLKSITGYQVTRPKQLRDADATDLTVFFGGVQRDSKQWTQEFQWSGTSSDERLSWLGSLFYFHEETDSISDFNFASAGTSRIKIDQFTENKSYGAGVSATYDLLENFSVRLGGRYIKDVKRNRILRNNPPQGSRFFAASLGICTGGAEDSKGAFRTTTGRDISGPDELRPGEELITNQDGSVRDFPDSFPDDGLPTCELSFRQTVGDVTFDFWPRDENHLYFTISNGFKGGGFALGETGQKRETATSLSTFTPEKIWAFMLGSKNTFFDDKLTLNLEGFFYNYRDQQLVLVDGFTIRTDNADSEMTGFDIEFDAEPFPGLRLDGNFSWMDTEFTEYSAVDPVDVITSANCRAEGQSIDPTFMSTPPGCTPTDYSGNELTRAPKLSYTIGAEYEFYLGRFGSLTPRIQFYYQDETWFRPFNRTAADSGANAPCPIPGLNTGNCRVRNGESFLFNGADARDLQEDYHYTDVKLVWTSPTDAWKVEAFVQNLEDTVVYQNLLVGTPLLDSPQMAWYGHPRIYGFRVGFRY